MRLCFIWIIILLLLDIVLLILLLLSYFMHTSKCHLAWVSIVIITGSDVHYFMFLIYPILYDITLCSLHIHIWIHAGNANSTVLQMTHTRLCTGDSEYFSSRFCVLQNCKLCARIHSWMEWAATDHQNCTAIDSELEVSLERHPESLALDASIARTCWRPGTR